MPAAMSENQRSEVFLERMGSQRTILVTGFPGFIAGRLVSKLAEPGVRLVLLAEPRFGARARSEAERIAQAKDLSAGDLEIVEGDITRGGLGLPPDALARLRAEVTDVFHLAAVYDLAVPRDIAFEVNVDGTRNVNELVLSLESLSRYNYVSTCYVAGKREGRILENELVHTSGFRNFYEETKYLAEVSVDELKSRLPVTVFRPSVVVGDSVTGATVKYDGIYHLIAYLMMSPRLLRFVNVGNSAVSLNLVPVDFVVDSIASLSRSVASEGRTVALADPSPLTTAQLFDVIAEALTGSRSVVTPPSRLVEMFLKSPFSPPLTGLPHAGVPYFFVPQTYDTSVGQTLLAAEGIECPRFADYVRALIGFMKSNPGAE